MEAQVNFHQNPSANLHYRQLRTRLKHVLKSLPEKRTRNRIYVVLMLPILYTVVYTAALHYRTYEPVFFALYAFLGILSVLMFVNIIHDAAHGNIFKKRSFNQVLLYIFDLLGANSYIWKKRHILLHHNYQNVVGWDSDVEQSGLIRIFKEDKPTIVSRNQHWLIFIFYPMYLLNWVLFRDFRDFFFKGRTIRKVCDIPKMEYVKLFLFKGLFLFYMVGIPILIGVSWTMTILAFLTMLIVGSIFALIFLLPPHVNDKCEFPVPNEEGDLGVSWFEHQFLSTNDVTLNNWLSRNVMGNFNYHIAHHLFPNISSVYSPEVTSEIKLYAQENGFHYRSYKLYEALYYHYKLIKANAIHDNFFEEDM